MSKQPNDLIPTPSTIEFQQSDDQLTIIRKWLDWKTLYLTFFTVIWNYSLLSTMGVAPLMTSLGLFMLPFLAVGIFLIYYAIAKWVNRTYIFANDNEIIVRYQPIPCPWLGNQRLRVANLKRIYSIKKVHRNAQNTNISYVVRANTHTGGDQKLVVVSNQEEAVFIEGTLENYYDVKDEPQQGEIGGPKSPNFWDRLF